MRTGEPVNNQTDRPVKIVDVHGEGHAWRWERVEGKWLRVPILRLRRGLYVSDEDDAIRYLCGGMDPKEFFRSIEERGITHEQRD